MRSSHRALRGAGSSLAIAGLLLLGYAGVGYARGALARDRARSAWEEAEARRAVVAATRAAALGTPSSEPVVPGAPVGRLIVPRLGMDEIVVEGVDERALRAGPGHLPGSALPGAPGNAVISAHRDRHFHRLDELVEGDSVVTIADGRAVTWTVAGRRLVKRGVPALFASRAPRLTLTTCWPVRYLGPAPERLIVTLEMRGEREE